MLIIIGLGNPGPNYADTRHNAGFKLVEELALKLRPAKKRLSILRRRDKWRREMACLIAEGSLAGQQVVLARPQTFMNLSGLAVAALLKKHRLTVEQLLIAYDDLDLPWGTLRLRRGGKSSGHKGVESIIEQLGREDFFRLRIGIGPCPETLEAAEFVLQPLTIKEKTELKETIGQAAEAVLTHLTSGPAAAMNRFNRSFLC